MVVRGPHEPPGISELVVRERLACAARGRDYPVERKAPGGIPVESLVDEITEKSPRLGLSPRQGRGDDVARFTFAPVQRYQRIVLGVVVAKVRNGIPHRGKADPHDDRILYFVDEIVGRVLRKAALQAQVNGAGDRLGAFLVARCERPGFPRDQVGLRVRQVATVQLRVGHAFRHGGIEPAFDVGRGGVAPDFRCPPRRDGGPVGMPGDGQFSADALAGGADLPPAPHHGVAQVQVESVADVFGRAGKHPVVGKKSLDQVEGALRAAVHYIVEDRAVAARHVHGLENAKLCRVFNPALGVARRLVEVDDHRVVRVGRVEFRGESASHPFVPTRVTKLPAVEGEFHAVDDHAGDP